MGASTFKTSSARAQGILPLCLCCVLSLVPFAPARAQSNDVSARLSHLENEINTLNRAVYKGEKPPAGSAAPAAVDSGMFDRVQQLENQVRDLTGKLEQQTYDNQQLQMRLDAMQQNTQSRLDGIEGQLRQNGMAAPQPIETGTPPSPMPGEIPPQPAPNAAPQQTPAPQAAAAPVPAPGTAPAPTTLSTDDAAALYEQGFGEIKAENYDAAEKTFSAFMKQFPDNTLAPNALYWLGETYYARKNYTQSSRVFAEAYRKYPNGPKAPDSLLKLGMSLSGSGKKSDACVALAQLKKQYPNGPAPVLTKADEEMTGLACQQ